MLAVNPVPMTIRSIALAVVGVLAGLKLVTEMGVVVELKKAPGIN